MKSSIVASHFLRQSVSLTVELAVLARMARQ